MLPNVTFSKWSGFGIDNLLIWLVSEWFLALYEFRNKILPNNHFAKYKIAEWFFAEKSCGMHYTLTPHHFTTLVTTLVNRFDFIKKKANSGVFSYFIQGGGGL